MRCLFCVCLALLLAAAVTGPAGASIITIDDFLSVDAPTPWPISVSSVGMTSATEGPAIPGVIGGVRSSTLVGEAFGIPGLDSISIGITPFPFGVIAYTATGGSDGLMRLVYDAGGASGGLHADFSANTGIRVEVSSFDRAGGVDMPVEVELHDGTTTITLEKLLTTAGPQSVLFPFADFSGIGGFDLTSIDRTEVRFDAQTAQDFHLDVIETYTIPEPATWSIAAVGSVILGSLALRRKARAQAPRRFV